MGLSAFHIKHMLKSFGKEVIIRRDNEGAYDSSTGTYVDGTPTETTVKAYMAANMLEQDQSSVKGERMVLVATTDVNGDPVPYPEISDKILGFRDPVVVVDFQEICEGETTSCYILGVNE
jgi:hypothetical protein